MLTIKGLTTGASRAEFEYTIPLEDARALLALSDGPVVEKNRRVVEHAGMNWEIDEFLGDNEGLIVAEVELESEQQEHDMPAWVGVAIAPDPVFIFLPDIFLPPGRSLIANRGCATGIAHR